MIVSISGMIGSGKTSLSKALNKHYKNSVLLEEFSEDDEVFNTYLKWIYSKKPNIDLSFQSFIIESLENSFNETNKKFQKHYSHRDNYIFLDRFNVEHIIFAIVTLSKKEPRFLKAFLDMSEYLINLENNPDLSIFLDANFEHIKDRILKRNRKVEIQNFNENYDYFVKLHSLYKEEFIKIATKYNIPYIILDTNNLNESEVLNMAIKLIDEYDFSNSKRYK